ncbi:MAG TPA: FHA domain-containing protein, partial [Bdellovibrionales bacterium]|nr:FHA domain-containing protein [Bdellovibrionales bacterium]
MSNGTLRVKIFDVAGTQRLPVSKPSATVGSAPHCDVVLNHPSVQGEHLRAWSEGGRIWVQDLGGGTGTTINGIRLPPLKPMLVRDLDVLKLAECPATLGFETNMVRAPVVQTVDLSEITATDIKVRL